MSANLKTKLRLGEADVEKFRLVEYQPLERCRLGSGLADGGANVNRVSALYVRRHHPQVDRGGGGTVDRLTVETPLVSERPRTPRFNPEHNVCVNADDRLNRRRRSRHGNVCASDDLGFFWRADGRQDRIENGSLTTRVAYAIADHHLVTAHVFGLVIVNRVRCHHRPSDILFLKPPLVSKRRSALELHRQ